MLKAALRKLEWAKFLMRVREVVMAGDKDRFIRFPWEIYRHDPHWVPR